ncbi:MAG: O-antigen ligase family protein [Methylacidiphilales bacterium]|nr:O-antigen ligase family protein [Candidatus Methylacidiphilales bacterium]
MFNDSGQVEYLLSRLTIFSVVAVFCILGIIFGISIGDQNILTPYLFFVLFFGVSLLLRMGEGAWILLVLGFSTQLPAIPLAGRTFEIPELSTMSLFAIFCARMAFRVQKFYPFRAAYTGVVLYTLWAFFIYYLHPIGLFAMGSSMAGARFYFKILISFFAFLVLANQKISNKQAKWAVIATIAGVFLTAGWQIWEYFNTGTSSTLQIGEDESYYTWQQILAQPPLYVILWLVCHYRMSEIFSLGRFYLMFIMAACDLTAFDSGKRAGVVVVLLVPIMVAFIRREWLYVVAMIVFLGGGIVFMVLGNGSLFDLPLRMQRVLVNLPGQWDRRVQSVTAGVSIDEFREGIRTVAYRRIKENPWIGPGFQINVVEMATFYSRQNLSKEDLYEGMAAGGNWHNTWLGMAADFGIPAAIFWGLFWAQCVYVGFRAWSLAEDKSWRKTLALMITLYQITQILRSWTSGHSSYSPFDMWWSYGLLLGIYYTILDEKKELLEAPGSRERADNKSLPATVS